MYKMLQLCQCAGHALPWTAYISLNVCVPTKKRFIFCLGIINPVVCSRYGKSIPCKLLFDSDTPKGSHIYIKTAASISPTFMPSVASHLWCWGFDSIPQSVCVAVFCDVRSCSPHMTWDSSGCFCFLQESKDVPYFAQSLCP